MIIFEDFIRDKRKAMNELYYFLNVNEFSPKYHVVNKSKKQSKFRRFLKEIGIDGALVRYLNPKWKTRIKNTLGFILFSDQKHKLTSHQQFELYDFFEKEIDQLETLLGKDLSLWRPN